MKMTAGLLLICLSCSTQQSPVADLGQSFAVAALRALGSVGRESERETKSRLLDAEALAQEIAEMKSMADLYALWIFLESNQVKEHDRQQAIIGAYQTATINKEHSLQWFLENDPVSGVWFKQDHDCTLFMDTSLRSRVYKALPVECRLKAEQVK